MQGSLYKTEGDIQGKLQVGRRVPVPFLKKKGKRERKRERKDRCAKGKCKVKVGNVRKEP